MFPSTRDVHFMWSVNKWYNITHHYILLGKNVQGFELTKSGTEIIGACRISSEADTSHHAYEIKRLVKRNYHVFIC